MIRGLYRASANTESRPPQRDGAAGLRPPALTLRPCFCPSRSCLPLRCPASHRVAQPSSGPVPGPARHRPGPAVLVVQLQDGSGTSAGPAAAGAAGCGGRGCCHPHGTRARCTALHVLPLWLCLLLSHVLLTVLWVLTVATYFCSSGYAEMKEEVFAGI